MQKTQTIMCLFGFLIILLSMDLIFGNPLRETFEGIPTVNDNTVTPLANLVMKSDDEPLHFGFNDSSQTMLS